jgi:HD-GYP domain-containing protein (c-di-GMP phosphodiesterase class II)
MNRKSDHRASLKDAESFARYVVPYEDRHVRLTRALASMAAVSIENAQLHSQIEDIFESFLKAAVSAVDARDPTTAGHSLRVASLTAELAEAVEHATRGRYRDLRFTAVQMRELRFAALLHDIGKVAVREDVLVKAKKLPPILWERIDARFDLIQRTMELERCRMENGQCSVSANDGGVDEQLAVQLQELERLKEIVRAANEPAMLAKDADASLRDIAQRTFNRADGRSQPYLTADELHFLQIARGTLDEQERTEIESHVQKTHQFLSGIPWTDNLKNLVTYASGHHEKLDGTGYPKRLTEKDIPVQTRLITLADMFDALTSSDRPYKAAVPADKALDIIRREADEGMLDRELVDIMTESHVYESILGQDWRQL